MSQKRKNLAAWGGACAGGAPGSANVNLHKTFTDHLTLALADPGGTASACRHKGPDSFVLTYKFFET